MTHLRLILLDAGDREVLGRIADQLYAASEQEHASPGLEDDAWALRKITDAYDEALDADA